MSKMQRDKGQRFERKIKKMFEAAMNIFLKRGNQTMGPYQPDIATKEYWIECTHGAMPRVYSKIEQALRDLKHKRNVEHKDKIPLIVFQKDRQMIWVALPLWHFFQLRGYDREKKEILSDIQSGKFAKQWIDECKSGQKNFLKMRKDLSNHPIEQVGEKLRALMPWIGKNKLIDKDKN